MEVPAELHGEGVAGLVYRLIDHSFSIDDKSLLWPQHSPILPPFPLVLQQESH